MDYVEMGKRIRKLRVDLGITQIVLAEKVGISASFLGHIERGSRVASIETLVSLASTLHTSTDYLLCCDQLTHASSISPVLSPQERMVAIAALDAVIDALRT